MSSNDPLQSKGLQEAYLLGELPQQQREEVQRRLLQDEDFYQSVLEAETDLIDAYARDQLSPRQSRLVKERLLAIPDNRRRLLFARQLQEAAAVETAHSPEGDHLSDPSSSAVHRLAELLAPLGGRRMAFIALAAVVALAAWLQIENSRLLQRQKALTQRVESLQKQLDNALPQDPPLPSHHDEALILAVRLNGSVRRSGNEVPQVPMEASTDMLELHLSLDPADNFPRYAVVLRSPTGEEKDFGGQFSARENSGLLSVKVRLPRRLLGEGRHEIELRGGNGTVWQTVDFYYVDLVPVP